MSTVTFVQADDWEAIYIDGKLHDQNHSVLRSYRERREFLEALGVEVEFIDAEDQVEELGEFPAILDEVVPDDAL